MDTAIKKLSKYKDSLGGLYAKKEYILMLRVDDKENRVLYSSKSREECCDYLNIYVREMLKKVLKNRYKVDVITDRHDRYEATLVSKEESRDIVLDVSI